MKKPFEYMTMKVVAVLTFLCLAVSFNGMTQVRKESAILPLEVNVIDLETENMVPQASIIIWRFIGENDSVSVDTLKSNGLGFFQCFLLVDEPTLFSFAIKSPAHTLQVFKVLAGPKSSNWQVKRKFLLQPYERGELSQLRRIGFEPGTLKYYPLEDFEALHQEIQFLKRYLSRQIRGNKIERIELIASSSPEEILEFGDSLAWQRSRQIQEFLITEGIPGNLIVISPQSSTTDNWVQSRVGVVLNPNSVWMGIKYAEPEHLRPKQ